MLRASARPGVGNRDRCRARLPGFLFWSPRRSNRPGRVGCSTTTCRMAGVVP